jgi:hypothetical protein
MYEILPIGAGVILALAFARWSPSSSRLRWVITALVSVIVGVSAAFISGEIHESWLFAIFDTAQVAVAMVLVSALLRRRADHLATTDRR